MVGDYDVQVSGTNCVIVVLLLCLVSNVDFSVIPLRHLLYQKMGIFLFLFFFSQLKNTLRRLNNQCQTVCQSCLKKIVCIVWIGYPGEKQLMLHIVYKKSVSLILLPHLEIHSFMMNLWIGVLLLLLAVPHSQGSFS